MKFKEIFRKDVVDRKFNGFVIYSGPSWYTLVDIGEAYLSASEKIIGPFIEAESKSETHIDDSLAHPCIFLLRHSLESYLKYYLICLINYNATNDLFYITADWNKQFQQHRLGPIANLIWRIVSPQGILQNSEFKKFLGFFNQFDEIDNNSTAFRYSTDSKGESQKIHDEQWYVEVLKFYELVMQVRSNILSFVNGPRWNYEELGYYEIKTITYIEENLSLLKNIQRILKERPKELVENEHEILNGERLIQKLKISYTVASDWENETKKNILETFSEEEIIRVCEAMYFGRDGRIHRPESLDIAFEKIYEKYHLIPEFIIRSEALIKDMKHFKNIRDTSPKFKV